MIKVAVVTAHYPSSTRPTDGRSAYQTLRALPLSVDVQVFYPNPAHLSLFKSRRNGRSNPGDSYNPPPDVKVNYFDYPVLPLISRPFNGWMAARALLPHVRTFAPDLILSHRFYPGAFAALQIGRALSIPVVAGGVGSD